MDFAGKTAVVTGGAEGIGYQIARAFAGRGMNVVLADIDTEMLDAAVKRLNGEGFPVKGIGCDVALKDDLVAVANKTIETFGKVHILVSNAGVSITGSQKHIAEENWRWIIDVNLMGVVYGAQVFTPLIQSHGESGHIVNVASAAGLSGVAFAGPYSATKAAVISLSETWRQELNDTNIRVSVLCPAFVKSRIYASMRNRQERYGGPVQFEEQLRQKPQLATQRDWVVNGIDTEIVGHRVLEALEKDEFYIFTHPDYRQVANQRSEAQKRAFDRADQSPALQGVSSDGYLNRDK